MMDVHKRNDQPMHYVELRILYMQKEGFVLICLYNNFTLDACRYNRYSSWYIVTRDSSTQCLYVTN